MSLYEIINPSDPYTFRAPDFLTAAAVVLVLGSGKYGLRRLDGKDSEDVPLLAFFPSNIGEEWLQDHYGVFGDWLHEHSEAVAAALESVMSFGSHERFAYDTAIAMLSPEQAIEYRDKVHDKNRSSMNDIGGYAWQLAEQLREKRTGEEP